MMNIKDIKETLNLNTVIFDLVFVGKLMKVIELSLQHIDKNSDDSVIVSDYINMLYTELTAYLTTEEIELAEEEKVFN